jgi:hypothetical protein
VSAEIIDSDPAVPDAFSVRGVLSVVAPNDAIAPDALLKAKLNGAEFYSVQISARAPKIDGNLTQFEYEHGPIAVSGQGRVDVELTFGDSGPTAVDQTYVIAK